MLVVDAEVVVVSVVVVVEDGVKSGISQSIPVCEYYEL